MCIYWATLAVWLYVYRESERILFYSTSFFSVSGWECLSVDVLLLSVGRCCCSPLFVDCMYIQYDVLAHCNMNTKHVMTSRQQMFWIKSKLVKCGCMFLNGLQKCFSVSL